MNKPRVFVSFSHKDSDFIQRLFDRLRAQPLELWDYSQESQEIPGGSNVLRSLQKRIDNCDVFLPVVSPHSFESGYARMEVEHALDRARTEELRLIPLVLIPCPKDWPAPYEDLQAIESYHIQTAASGPEEWKELRRSVEEALRRLCRVLRIAYRPLPIEDPRLPFLLKFDQELKEAQKQGNSFQHEKHQIDIFGRLGAARTETGDALRIGYYSEALKAINYFIAICEYEIPKHSFYYSYIVKGICLVSSGQFLPALDLLRPMLQHAGCDENLFGLLGYIKQQQGAYHEALDFYRQSVDRDPRDPAAHHGLLLSAMCSDTPLDIDACLRRIETGNIALPQDRYKVRSLKAYVYAQAGRTSEAIHVYEEMLMDGNVDAGLLVNMAHCLRDAGETQRALTLLQRYQGQFELDDIFLHHLGSLYFQMGELQQARQCLERLIIDFPRQRQYMIDTAQVRWENGDRAGARELAARILDRTQFGLPVSANDFFCDGFAHWLLGNPALADYDFARSGLPSENHYRHLSSGNS